MHEYPYIGAVVELWYVNLHINEVYIKRKQKKKKKKKKKK
jgi:hypothetical protein